MKPDPHSPEPDTKGPSDRRTPPESEDFRILKGVASISAMTPTDGTSTATAQPQQAHGHGLLKELAIVVVLIAILVPAVWVVFGSDFFESKDNGGSKSSQQQQLEEYLRNAARQVYRDRLTWPADDNALSTYLEAMSLFPESAEVYAGIRDIANRYLALIEELLQDNELGLAQRTLDAARQVVPHMQSTTYGSDLARAEEQLRAQEKRLLQQQVGPDRSYQNFEMFRDRLNSGGTGPAMVHIPAGEFMMGSADDEAVRDADEGPRHLRQVAAFALGHAEVTFEEYDQFAKATDRDLPDDGGWGRGKHPVIGVSWRDARAYTAWLKEQTGYNYRLPTEAEWEYAARAGSSGRYASGECLTPMQANFDDRKASDFPECASSGGFVGRTVVVASLSANPWGLYNMHGNVREFVQDCWQFSYAGGPLDSSPRFTAEGGGCAATGNRVLRGGAWDGDMKTSRSANRFAADETKSNPSFGFRVARDIADSLERSASTASGQPHK